MFKTAVKAHRIVYLNSRPFVVFDKGVLLKRKIAYDVENFFLPAVSCRDFVAVHVHKDEYAFEKVLQHPEAFVLLSHTEGLKTGLAQSTESNINEMSGLVPIE